MRGKWVATCLVVLSALIALVLWSRDPTTASICTCATAIERDVACEKCKVGYLAGVRIDSFTFFEALDAHGHEIDTNLVTCASCKNALATDGFCDTCKIGFIQRQAYFSKLSHLVGRGELKTRESIRCPTCLKHTERPGWCETCKIGMVGFHAYKDKKEYEQTVHARDLMIQGMAEAGRCMPCAMAIVNDGPCLLCKVSYTDGKKTPLPE